MLFLAIAFYFGPNVILFKKLTWITPADFVVTVEGRCVPVVSAMKAYRRDHGHLPERLEDIVPGYLASTGGSLIVYKGQFTCWTKYNHLIEYDFSPATEGWKVHGPYTHGRIPAPPAPMGPTTSPSISPSTRSSS
jgi:hypothetical protein